MCCDGPGFVGSRNPQPFIDHFCFHLPSRSPPEGRLLETPERSFPLSLTLVESASASTLSRQLLPLIVTIHRKNIVYLIVKFSKRHHILKSCYQNVGRQLPSPPGQHVQDTQLCRYYQYSDGMPSAHTELLMIPATRCHGCVSIKELCMCCRRPDVFLHVHESETGRLTWQGCQTKRLLNQRQI